MLIGADALCVALAGLGCETVWALGASRIDQVLSAARRSPALTVRGASTELDAVFAADGASRVNGVGVAAFIGSVGLANAAAGVQTLVGEGRPVLLLVGQTAPGSPRPISQDTRVTDLPLLRGLGCAAWPVADESDLLEAWPAVMAELRASRPAALLIDESALNGPWRWPPLETAPMAPEQPDRGSPVPVRQQMDRAAIWDALAVAAPDAHAFADAGQTRQVASSMEVAMHVHQCPATASLGWAVPAAMGASSARRTYAVCGDGGFMMSLAAVASIGHHRLPVTVVVAVNGLLGVDAARTAPAPADLLVPAIDYLKFARACNVEAAEVTKPQQIVDHCRSQVGPQLLVAQVPVFEPIPQLQ